MSKKNNTKRIFSNPGEEKFLVRETYPVELAKQSYSDGKGTLSNSDLMMGGGSYFLRCPVSHILGL